MFCLALWQRRDILHCPTFLYQLAMRTVPCIRVVDSVGICTRSAREVKGDDNIIITCILTFSIADISLRPLSPLCFSFFTYFAVSLGAVFSLLHINIQHSPNVVSPKVVPVVLCYITCAVSSPWFFNCYHSVQVHHMNEDDVKVALQYCREWNTNSRHCHAAQAMLRALLRHKKPPKLMTLPGKGALSNV
jgi:hypothetical protein